MSTTCRIKLGVLLIELLSVTTIYAIYLIADSSNENPPFAKFAISRN